MRANRANSTAWLGLLALVSCAQHPTTSAQHSEASRECGTRDPPRPPSSPCQGFADSNPAAVSFDGSAFGVAECQRESFAITDRAPNGHVPASELGALLREDRDLVYCGGDEWVSALGWSKLQRGTTPAQLRFTPGDVVAYMQCRSGERRAHLEDGWLRLKVGSREVSASAELSADERYPQRTTTFGEASSTACGLQIFVRTSADQAEACLSARDAQGNIVYAAFRSRCE